MREFARSQQQQQRLYSSDILFGFGPFYFSFSFFFFFFHSVHQLLVSFTSLNGFFPGYS
jgi:hypothetical protein